MFSTAEKSCITIAFGEAEGEIAAVVSRGWGTSTKKKERKRKKEKKEEKKRKEKKRKNERKNGQDIEMF